MSKKLLVGLAALAFAAGASAQGYGVISAGVSKLSVDCAGAPTCDKSDTAFKLLGGYMLNPNLAVEVGYFDFGKAKLGDPTIGTGSITVSAFGGGVAWHQDLSQDWNFVARLGLAQVKTKLSATLIGVGSGSDSDNKVQAYAGLGVGYKLSKTMSLDLAWDTSRGKYSKNGISESGTVNAYSVGLTFGF
ncbi:MAG: porin family protein [Aquincola sp.]|nr:porin family protein [Aquincola sp.]MDH4290201.1 porin family protein [Aquincola sp.]MDH5329357.1 porin family protein [Aquincola sp.]